MGICYMCAGLWAADPGTGAPGTTTSYMGAGLRSDDVAAPTPPAPGVTSIWVESKSGLGNAVGCGI